MPLGLVRTIPDRYEDPSSCSVPRARCWFDPCNSQTAVATESKRSCTFAVSSKYFHHFKYEKRYARDLHSQALSTTRVSHVTPALINVPLSLSPLDPQFVSKAQKIARL